MGCKKQNCAAKAECEKLKNKRPVVAGQRNSFGSVFKRFRLFLEILSEKKETCKNANCKAQDGQAIAKTPYRPCSHHLCYLSVGFGLDVSLHSTVIIRRGDVAVELLNRGGRFRQRR